MTLMFRTYPLDLGHVVINKKWNGAISWLFLNYQLSHFKPCWQNNYCCTKTNTNCVHRQLHDKLWDAICIVSYVDNLDLLHCAVLSLNVESLLSLISMESVGLSTLSSLVWTYDVRVRKLFSYLSNLLI